MAAQKRKTRMYEPWGYRDENNYQGTEIIMENDLDSFFAKVAYNKDDNKIHFSNKDGEEKATIDVSEFIKSDMIVERTWYDDGKIYIKFTNGDLITIDVKELIDETEFADGLQVNNGIVSIKLDQTTEGWITVSSDGIKVSGIQAEIDRLDAKIDQEISDREADVDAEETRATSEEQRIEAKLDDEIARATAAEQTLDAKIDQEIADREADVDAEETRATSEEQRIETKLDNEISRATEAEQLIDNKVNTLNAEIDAEERRAEASEQEIRTLLTKEISDRIADVDEEEARASSEEQRIESKLDDEIARATAAEQALDAKIDQEIADREADVDAEEARAVSAETDLQTAINAEVTRATNSETALQGAIEAEGQRAQDAETDLNTSINEEIENRKNNSVASVNYDESGKTIDFYNENNVKIDSIDATAFIKDGMIDSVSLDTISGTTYLVIVWNTDSGKQEETRLDIGDLFEADNYYAKNEIDDKVSTINDNIASEASARESGDNALEDEINSLSAIVDTKANSSDVNAALDLKADKTEIPTDFYTKGEVDGKDAALQSAIDANATAIAKKVDKEINGTNGKALIFNEADGGGAKFEHSDGTWSFAGVNDGGENGIAGQIYAIKKNEENKFEGARIDVSKNGMYYTVGADAASDRMVADNEIAVKGNINEAVSGKADADTVYTQEEVNALLLEKETEIYNLTKIVGDIGGAVTYNLPNEAGKSFNTLMGNNGTVKLTDDVTTGRFGPGVLAKNAVKLNINNNNLTITGLTTTSAQGAIMSRGTQEITIYGKGTIDAGEGICIEANGADSVINLTGSTTVYQTDRSGGELVYCYAGTINITNGTFKNNGEDKTYLLNCYDSNYRNGTAKIIVTGGKFYDFNPADNSAEGEHTSFVAEGYHVEESIDGESTVYTVKKDS